MNIDHLIQRMQQHVALTQEDIQYISQQFLPLHVPQGNFAEEVGKPLHYFIHVYAGCLMSYYTDDAGHDHVIQFATSGWWTGNLSSFVQQEPSTYSTRALVDSEILLLPRKSFDDILEKCPQLERYFRILFQNSLITHQDRLLQNLSYTAEARYQAFQKKYPTLEHYVPQKYIASYLGITPEFLSKIRRKLSGKA
jgi:CRP-like cAMP-binding protein